MKLKLRNLEDYRRSLTNGPIVSIGTGTDTLSKALFGDFRNLTTFQNYIVTVSHFAESYQEQVVLELLPNAVDIKADSFFLGFDDKNFLVLNNGNPFSTVKNDKESLLSFLDNKQYKAAQDIGKYGQGSKLIYNLLPHNDGSTRDAQILDTLVNDLKGPIIFSWNHPSSIIDFLNWNILETPEYVSYTDMSSPLLCKIIQTYYPARLNETKQTQNGEIKLLFSTSELRGFQKFLGKMFSSHLQGEDYRFHKKGTVIYLPVGKGQLPSDFIDRITPSIKGFLGFKKEIKFVKINGSKIPKLDFTQHELKKSGGIIAIPKKMHSIDGKLVNFYKDLPILRSAYGLKFVVNYHHFQVPQHRQSIEINDDSGKYNLTLSKKIVKDIIELLSELSHKVNKYEDYISLIKSILSYEDKEGIGEVRNLFIDNLLEALKKSLPSSKGQIYTHDKIKINNSGLEISLDKVLMDRYWLAPELNDVEEHLISRLGIEKVNVVDLIHLAEKEKNLTSWLNGLTNSEYKHILTKIGEQSIGEINNLKFIRCSDKVVRSINDLLENKDCLITTKKTNRLIPIFKKYALVYTDPLLKLNDTIDKHLISSQNEQSAADSILAILEQKKNDIDYLEARLILDVLVDELNLESEWLREKFHLFRSIENLQLSLSKLMNKSNNFNDIGWLKYLRVKSIQLNDSFPDSLFMQNNETWSIAFMDQLEATQLFIRKKKGLQYFNEVRRLTNSAFGPKNLDKLSSIKFLLNDQGFYTPQELFIVESLKDLSKSEYELFESTLNIYTNLKSLPYIDVPLFSDAGFGFAEKDLATSILAKQEKIGLDAEKLAVVTKIYPDFFKRFHPTDESGKNFSKKEDGKSLFYSIDMSFVSSVTGLSENAIFLGEVLKYYKDLPGVKNEKKILKKIIDDEITIPETELGHLIDYALLLDKEDKQKFIELIEELGISSEVDSYNKQSYQHKIIQLAIAVGRVKELRLVTFLDEREIKDYKYDNEVKFSNPEDNYSLSYLLPEKYGNTAEVLDKTKKLFVDLDNDNKKTFFISKPVEYKVLYDEIIAVKKQSASQTAFAIAYHQSNENISPINITPAFSEGELLDELYTRYYEKFNEYYQINEVDLKDLIFSKELVNYYHLLADQEKSPSWLNDWINNDSDKLNFLYKAGLCKSHDEIIQVRNSINENKACSTDVIEKLFVRKRFLNNTLQNFVLQEFPLHSNSVKVLRDIYKKIGDKSSKLDPLCLLSYKANKNGKVKACLRNIEDDFDQAFYTTSRESKTISQIVQGLNSIKNPHNLVDGWNLVRYITNQNNNIREIDLLTSIKEKDLPQWNNKTYKRWSIDLKYGHKILLAKDSVTEVKLLKSGDDIVYEYKPLISSATTVDNKEDFLKIYAHTDDHEKVLNILLDDKDRLFMHKLSDFFDLYMMIKEDEEKELENIYDEYPGIDSVEDIKKALKSVESDPVDKEEVGRTADEGHELIQIEEGLSDEDTELLEKNAKEIADIVSHYTLEKLKELFKRYKGDLDKLIEDHEEKESTVNEVYGYLGEALFNCYLKKKGLNDFQWASQPPIKQKEYDFEVAGTKVDVKTNIGSLLESDGSLPFYIHKSQIIYVKNHPNIEYDISRIGLTDIGLQHNAREINKYYKGELTKELKDKINHLAKAHLSDTSNMKQYETIIKDFVFGLNQGHQ